MAKSIINHGATAHLTDELLTIGAKHILLVTGKSSYQLCGAEANITSQLEALECIVTHFNDFTPNPKLEELAPAIEQVKTHTYDCIVAIGGGSVIDTAKILNFFGHNHFSPETYLTEDCTNIKPSVPLIAIPTTAGSGRKPLTSPYSILGVKNILLLMRLFYLLWRLLMLRLPRIYLTTSQPPQQWMRYHRL